MYFPPRFRKGLILLSNALSKHCIVVKYTFYFSLHSRHISFLIAVILRPGLKYGSHYMCQTRHFSCFRNQKFFTCTLTHTHRSHKPAMVKDLYVFKTFVVQGFGAQAPSHLTLKARFL